MAFYKPADRAWTCNCGWDNRQGTTHCGKCKIAWQDYMNAFYKSPQGKKKRQLSRLRRMARR